MELNYNDYFKYCLPEGWCSEESGDYLLIYNPEGEGAMTLSFYNVFQETQSLYQTISIMAKKFIDNNHISLRTPFVIRDVKNDKMILCGDGKTEDKWFVKLWVIAKERKIVFVTYQSEEESAEVTICDTIVNDMTFVI